MKKILFFCLLASAGLVSWACGSNPTTPASQTTTPSSVSFSTTLYPLISANCFSCHANGSTSGGMNLGNPASVSTVYAAWLGSGSGAVASTTNNCGISDYIAPKNPSGSLVLQKLNGSCSPQMPEGGTPWTSTQLSDLTSWINAGAPNN